VAAPAAFAASIDIGQTINGSLQEIIIGVVTALVAGLVGWVAVVVKNKFNIDIEAKHREAITAFVQRQASSLIAMGAVSWMASRSKCRTRLSRTPLTGRSLRSRMP
jgi:hypothetical protein